MWRDEAYLLDILIAARKILAYTDQVTYEDYLSNDLVQDAVERQFEIIGEAARLISEEVRQQHSEIPWGLMVGLRNQLIHNYRNIDVHTMWSTIHTDLPGLIDQLEELVPPEELT